MTKSKIIYQENPVIFAKYHHPQSDDWLEYRSTIQIKNIGKTPVVMKMKFDGIPPAYAAMPPNDHTFKAENIIDLYLKLKRWFWKYGYEIK